MKKLSWEDSMARFQDAKSTRTLNSYQADIRAHLFTSALRHPDPCGWLVSVEMGWSSNDLTDSHMCVSLNGPSR